MNVRLYGETEFWFALIKSAGDHRYDRLWPVAAVFWSRRRESQYRQPLALRWFLRHRLEWADFVAGGNYVLLRRSGQPLGLLPLKRDPEKSIPKAVNQVVYRILLFYIGSLVVLLALYPWVEVKSNSSPFVMIFHNLDSNVVASALNFVILVASLSVYNSGVYSNSRMLFGLSVQGNAPKFLTRVSRRGVPINSLMLSGAITSLVVLINYLLPQKAFGLLMALVVATLLLNWIMICLAHLRFRAAMRRQGRETQFKALLYPFGNYLCIAFLGLFCC